jgi:site-specific DNA recombinase
MITSKSIPFKIALYVRVSTEEQAQNPEGSIKSQEDRLRQFVDFKNLEGNFGSVVDVFIDRAKSGKDTKRPQLQRLLISIRKKEVNLVMVSELSRLSRSIRDFTDMWELMKAQGCGFLSLREQFDTTTAAGEMVLYTIANISQFERKQVSERVSANFLSRAKRGLFNGGSVPFGYEMNPENKAYLVVNEEDAEVIRACFDAYLDQNGLGPACRYLNERGYTFALSRMGQGHQARLKHFTVDSLQRLLRNQAYIGMRVFVENRETKVTKACWPAIVDPEKFERVQKMLTKNYDSRVKDNYPNRYPYILANLMVCGQCGERLPGKSAHGCTGKVGYYEHSNSVKKQAALTRKLFNCAPTRFPAKIVEPLVWQEVDRLLQSDTAAKGMIELAEKRHTSNAKVSECDRLRSKIKGLDGQLKTLAEHLSKLPKTISPTAIYNQLSELETMKAGIVRELQKLQSAHDYVDRPASLKDYKKFLEQLRNILHKVALPDEKSALLKALIHKIELFPDRVKLYFLVSEAPIQIALASGLGSELPKKLLKGTKTINQISEVETDKKILVTSSKKHLLSGPTPT